MSLLPKGEGSLRDPGVLRTPVSLLPKKGKSVPAGPYRTLRDHAEIPYAPGNRLVRLRQGPGETTSERGEGKGNETSQKRLYLKNQIFK